MVLKHTAASVASQVLSGGRFTGMFPDNGESHTVTVKYCPTDDADNQFVRIKDTGDPSLTHRFLPFPFEHETKATITSWYAAMSQAGCDILSSCFYSIGVCISYSGQLAPLCFLLAMLTMYYFRQIYVEVITATPRNGGIYNVIINTSSKKAACFASGFSLISSTASATISAYVMVLHISNIWPIVDIGLMTIGVLLTAFMCYVLGAKISPRVSFLLVLFHLLVLGALLLWGFGYACQDEFSTYISNMRLGLPTVNYGWLAEADWDVESVLSALFFGYATALVSHSGLETTGNFIEDMHSEHIFVTTVKYLWYLSGIINVALSVVVFMVVPSRVMWRHPGDLFAVMGYTVGGKVLQVIVVADATAMLGCNLLLAYSSVCNLLKRVSEDHILPSFLSNRNRLGTMFPSAMFFLVFSVCIFCWTVTITNRTNISTLFGLYSLAFLCVLLTFVVACFLLKYRRFSVPRLIISPPSYLVYSLVGIIIGFSGIMVGSPTSAKIFCLVLFCSIVMASCMLFRVHVLSGAIVLIRVLNFGEQQWQAHKKKEDDLILAYDLQKQFDEEKYISLESVSLNDLEHHTPEGSIPDILHPHTRNRKSNHKSNPSKYLSSDLAISLNDPAFDCDNDPAFDDFYDVDDKAHYDHSHLHIFHRNLHLNPSLTSSTSASQTQSEDRPSFPSLSIPTTSCESSVPTTSSTSSVSNRSGNRPTLKRRPPPLNLKSLGHQNSSRIFFESPGIPVSTPETPFAPYLPVESLSELKYNLLDYCMTSLDDIVSSPVVFFAKSPDPIALNMAVEYIQTNEDTNVIIIVHVVDDRLSLSSYDQWCCRQRQSSHYDLFPTNGQASIRSPTWGDDQDSVKKQLEREGNEYLLSLLSDKTVTTCESSAHEALEIEPHGSPFAFSSLEDSHLEDSHGNTTPNQAKSKASNLKQLDQIVAVLDAVFTTKQINCVVVRGSCFCPATIRWISSYLHVPMHRMMMGIPDGQFPFPLSMLDGVRIIIPNTEPRSRHVACTRMQQVLLAQAKAEAPPQAPQVSVDDSPQFQQMKSPTPPI